VTGAPRLASADKRFLVPVSPEVEAVEHELEQLAAGGGPIVAGPWQRSAREELLEWIPFLRWACDRFGIDPQRMTAVSREGVGSWYEGVCAAYADAPTDDHPPTLDPELASRVSRRYHEGRGAIQELLDRLRFERILAPEPPADLPQDFVAVAFEPCTAFPETAENGDLVDRLLGRLRSQADVVVVRAGFGLDAHQADQSLGACTAVLGHARALVASFADVAHVGLALAAPTLALYSDAAAIRDTDLDLIARAARRLGATFTALDSRHVEFAAELAASHA
jgi:hypothetical protein